MKCKVIIFAYVISNGSIFITRSAPHRRLQFSRYNSLNESKKRSAREIECVVKKLLIIQKDEDLIKELFQSCN